MNALEILEKEIIGQEGSRIGKVKDLIFDHSSWTVNALIVELENNVAEEFNVKKHLSKTRIRISVHHVQGVSDRIVLRVPKDDLFRPVTQPPAQ